ncbi:MAG: 6-carboxytetrahydropterin synthase QueD [Gammaproteobacteria bacterium]|nr:6-carboxytetrahydropterin synthase QueD [Gammaproteobacteria bacterium]
MTACYTLKIITEFASAHSLRDYPGECRRLHGHNWKVEVEIISHQLDKLGMVIDFKAVKSATKTITDQLDHHYLNEIEPFNRINPTAENIAAFLYKSLSEEINDEVIQVKAITLWETERASVHYTES